MRLTEKCTYFLCCILALALTHSRPVLAQGQLGQPLTNEHTNRFFKSVERALTKRTNNPYLKSDQRSIQRRIREGARAVALAPAQWAAHSGQTFMLLWILAGVEAVRQQEKISSLESNPTPKLELLANVGDHMINDFSLFASMAGASVVGTAMTQPLHLLNQLIRERVTHRFLSQLLTHGAASFVTFLGWEAGARLWHDAILQLPEEQIPIAKKLRFMDILAGKANDQDRRIFQNILSQVYQILLFANPEVTKNWLYNTWRLNIATGEFVTLITSMVTFGVAAGSLAPGAGNLMGLLFGFGGGLVGGFVAIFIPHEYKAPVTDGFRRIRIQTANQRLHVNTSELKRISRYFKRSSQPWNLDYQIHEFKRSLAWRQNVRNDAATALIEQIYDALLRYQNAEAILTLIDSINNQKLMAVSQETLLKQTPKTIAIADLKIEMQTQRRDSQDRLLSFYWELLQRQKSESLLLGRFLFQEDLPASLKQALTNALKDQEVVHSALKHVLAGLFPETKPKLALQHLNEEDLRKLSTAAHILLNQFYLMGFKETFFLE